MNAACSASRPTWSPRTTATQRTTIAVVEQAEHGVEERGPLGRVDAGRPELLELVADQQRPARPAAASPVSVRQRVDRDCVPG